MPALIAVCLLALLAACGGSDGPSAVAPASPAAPAQGPASAPPRGDLFVFAASSLTDAFTEIGEEFHRRHPAVLVDVGDVARVPA